jgi:catechol 2,3-dioxygenase-like lactoylglutathione lyase family enzyme
VITVEDIAYARYELPDLDAAEAFMKDYGLTTAARTETSLYMRGAGPAHHIYVADLAPESRSLGFGMYAQSEADLERLAADTGAKVERCTEPGGGKKVTLTDPAGYRVEVIHGQAKLAPLPVREPIAINPSSKRTRMNRTVRIAAGPGHAMRLGHIAIHVPNLSDAIAFYANTLGMKIADTYYVGTEDAKIAAFMRCGLGQRYTDHHTLALLQLPKSGFDHASFEMLDWDDLMIGHDHMAATGKYKHSWGPGRHFDGSNIFDYWRDPFGNKIERYTDGDVVNDDYQPSNSALDPGDMRKLLAMWGPPISEDFLA